MHALFERMCKILRVFKQRKRHVATFDPKFKNNPARFASLLRISIEMAAFSIGNSSTNAAISIVIRSNYLRHRPRHDITRAVSRRERPGCSVKSHKFSVEES